MTESSEDVYFWVFILICVVAFLTFINLHNHKYWKEGYEGIYRMDPTDIASPSPNNVYVTLNALTEAEKNFDVNAGPYML